MHMQHRVKQFIKETFFVDDIAEEESFLVSGIIDSLGILQLVGFVESVAGIRVPDTDLLPENFDSVARIAAYIERQLRAAAA